MHNIISNIFKKFLLFVILILYCSFVTANSADVVSATGVITLTIVNRPPVITDIYFSPELPLKIQY